MNRVSSISGIREIGAMNGSEVRIWDRLEFDALGGNSTVLASTIQPNAVF